jgi:hypothetical protein
MSSQISYLDGNAAAGELSKIFAMDVTGAESQCANCGAKRRLPETPVGGGGVSSPAEHVLPR